MFTKGLKDVVHRFRMIGTVAGAARRDIMLANYVEYAASSIIGVANVRPFLQALVEC